MRISDKFSRADGPINSGAMADTPKLGRRPAAMGLASPHGGYVYSDSYAATISVYILKLHFKLFLLHHFKCTTLLTRYFTLV